MAVNRKGTWSRSESGVRQGASHKARLDPQGSGYGNYGASRNRKSLKGWQDAGGSAAEDIHANLSTLRERSRDLYMGVPLATGALKRYRTNVIGSGLTPKPMLDADALGLTEEAADALEKRISQEFYIWADSTNCDAERLSNFYELQQLAFLNWLMSGDVFALLQTKARPGTPYRTCVLLIEADRVCTPGDWQDIGGVDEKIMGGVEVNIGGEIVAYHIAKRHPLSWKGTSISPNDFVRVEAYGKTGRRNILHVMSRERIGARRGVPLLAPVIETLKLLGRYTDAEMTAAVVQGFQSLIIETTEPTTEPPIGEVGEETGGDPDKAFLTGTDEGEIRLGPGAIIGLGPGEQAKPFTPSRPNATFDGFVGALTKQIGAALELPSEILLQQFTASYSASRAALLEAWKAFSQWRDWMVERFCQPIYEEWMAEAVALGRIPAPGFFGDPGIRKAYANAQWYGPTQGQLDPVKEVRAAELRVQSGFSTRAKEAMELTGTDLWENIRAAKRETELMRDAGLVAEDPTAGDGDAGEGETT